MNISLGIDHRKPTVSGSQVIPVPYQVGDVGAWYDASDLPTIAHSNGLVDILGNKGPSGPSLTAAGIERPSTGLNSINGRNVLFFDGVGNILQNSSMSIPSSVTIFFVGKVISNDETFDSLYSLNHTFGNGDYQVIGDPSTSFSPKMQASGLGFSSVESGIPQLGKAVVYGDRFSAPDNNYQMWMDGSLVGSSAYNGGLFVLLDLKIASNRSGVIKTNLDFGEFIIFLKALTVLQMTAVNDYLLSKWGIPAI